MANRREVLHLAVGSPACLVSAHYLNLQGLAGTDSDAVVCDPAITHSTYRDVYVPRAVLVDTNRTPTTTAFSASSSTPEVPAVVRQDSALHFPTWKRTVETIELDPIGGSSQISQRSLQFRKQAEELAYSAYSRYRVPKQQQQQVSVLSSYASTDGRHVNWDDEGEEEEEEDEPDEDEMEMQRRQEQQKQLQWKQNCQSTQHALDAFWATPSTTETTAAKSVAHTMTDASGSELQEESLRDHSTASWRDYLMPPLHPKTCLDAPYYSDVISDNNSNDFIENVLWERIRKILEDCDACQGLTMLMTTSGGGGVFAGWGTAILREWNDECPHTSQMVIDVDNTGTNNDDSTAKKQRSSIDNVSSSMPSAEARRQEQRIIRGKIQRALALSEHTELADLYLPLHLGKNQDDVAMAAAAAAALESITLPYRLTGNNSCSQLALQSYYSGTHSGSNPFGTAPNLTFREFVQNLQRQSASKNVVEIDVMLPWNDSRGELDTRLKQGTSVERDQRMRQRGRETRSGNVLPGEWLQDTGSSGLMSSLSPVASGEKGKSCDRSLHYNFALSTGFRPSSAKEAISDSITCIMEGMGIRYRPEQSMAVVVKQSLAQLALDGYGAGSYWKTVFANAGNGDRYIIPSLSTVPLLATVGNTTRIYPYLHESAMEAQQILSPRNKKSASRAFFNRDVLAGILPELDDCQAAVSACLDLRDLYEPPEGSGLVVDAEGSYFDMS